MFDVRRCLPDGPLLRTRSRAPLGARTRSSAPHTFFGSLDHTDDLAKSSDAGEAHLFAGMLRASLSTAVRSQPRSQPYALFGARILSPKRRFRAENIELDKDRSSPLYTVS